VGGGGDGRHHARAHDLDGGAGGVAVHGQVARPEVGGQHLRRRQRGRRVDGEVVALALESHLQRAAHRTAGHALSQLRLAYVQVRDRGAAPEPPTT